MSSGAFVADATHFRVEFRGKSSPERSSHRLHVHRGKTLSCEAGRRWGSVTKVGAGNGGAVGGARLLADEGYHHRLLLRRRGLQVALEHQVVEERQRPLVGWAHDAGLHLRGWADHGGGELTGSEAVEPMTAREHRKHKTNTQRLESAGRNRQHRCSVPILVRMRRFVGVQKTNDTCTKMSTNGKRREDRMLSRWRKNRNKRFYADFWGESDPNRSILDPFWPHFGRRFAKFRPNLLECGGTLDTHTHTHIVKCRLHLAAKFGGQVWRPVLANFGQTSAKIGQRWPKLGRWGQSSLQVRRPVLANLGHTSNNTFSSVGTARSQAGAALAHPGSFRRSSAQVSVMRGI